jgi:hypothetical protein
MAANLFELLVGARAEPTVAAPCHLVPSSEINAHSGQSPRNDYQRKTLGDRNSVLSAITVPTTVTMMPITICGIQFFTRVTLHRSHHTPR